jgi:hypothetical protein
MRLTSRRVRLGSILLAGLVVGGWVAMHRPADPDIPFYRLRSVYHACAMNQYQRGGCSNSGPLQLDLDLWEKVDSNYQDTMRRLYSAISDWKGEPPFEFRMLERYKGRF